MNVLQCCGAKACGLPPGLESTLRGESILSGAERVQNFGPGTLVELAAILRHCEPPSIRNLSDVLTPLAKADIFDIWSYIADDNEDAADRVEQAIYDACAFVAQAPMRGHSRPGITTRSLRFWTLTRFPNYAVVYRPETAPLEIVAVMHGRRNIRRILKERK